MCGTHYEKWRRNTPKHLRPAPEGRKFHGKKLPSKWINPDGSRMTCLYRNCKFVIDCQGLCKQHYASFWYESTRGKSKTTKRLKWRDIDGSPITHSCSFEGCDLKVRGRSLCDGHLTQVRRGHPLQPLHLKAPCSVPKCETLIPSRGETPFCRSHKVRMRKYSLSADEIIRLFETAQCANRGCGSKENLHIDHDHSCCPPGKFNSQHVVSCGGCVRGLLCAACNLALGRLREDVDVISGLLDFLERNRM